VNPSLSVVVPLHNVQSTLTATVEELLEIVSELTPTFEVLLVDDASTDATRDAANELSLGYPQVQVIAQSRQLGPQDSLRNALRFTYGEYVLCCTDRPEFDLHELRKLWDRKTSGGAVWGLRSAGSALGSIPPLPIGRPTTVDAALPDLLLAPRRLLAAWHGSSDRQNVLAHLRGRGFAVQGIELRRRSFGGSFRAQATFPVRPVARMVGPRVRSVASAPVDRVAPPVQRPNLLNAKNRSAARDD
jgi:glycosyltransferase involved in cell wall biosynthesis